MKNKKKKKYIYEKGNVIGRRCKTSFLPRARCHSIVNQYEINPASFSRLSRPVGKINFLTRGACEHTHRRTHNHVPIPALSEAPVNPFGNPSGAFGQKASDATVTTINPLRSEFDGERRGDRGRSRKR